MRRILAVDDNNDILEIIQYVLEDQGYQVDTMSCGTGLLEKIDQQKPDLILLDVMLGDMDGREICKDVKSNKNTSSIPVILVSASHHAEASINKDNGPDDFIAKPFDIDTLINKVETHLKAA